MSINNRVKEMEKEVGLLPMICLITDCKEPEKALLTPHYCVHQHDYTKIYGHRTNVLTVCSIKVEEYFLK